MTVIVERVDQLGADEAGKGESEGSQTIPEIGFECPHLISTVIVMIETEAATVARLGERPSGGIIPTLGKIYTGIWQDNRHELEDTAIKRYVVSNPNCFGMKVHIALSRGFLRRKDNLTRLNVIMPNVENLTFGPDIASARPCFTADKCLILSSSIPAAPKPATAIQMRQFRMSI